MTAGWRTNAIAAGEKSERMSGLRGRREKKNIKLRSAPSTITWIVVIIVALVLPINVFTLVLTRMVVKKTNEQTWQEVQNNLDYTMEMLSGNLSQASKRMIYLVYNDEDFLRLENDSFPEGTSASNSLYEAKEELKFVRQQYSMVDIIYCYFLRSDLMVTNGFTSISSQNYRDYVSERAGEDTGYGTEWEMIRLKDTPMLYGRTRWNQADFGVFVDLNSLLASLKLSDILENKTVFFANRDGSIITEDGAAYLQQEELTFGQLKRSAQYHVFMAQLEDCDLYLVEVTKGMLIPSKGLVALQVISILLSALVVPLLLLYINRWVSQPINRLLYGISRVERGDMEYRIGNAESGREFDQINENFNDMMDRVSELKIDVYEKELERNKIKMRYLSEQIQPHFILNAMNILYSYEPEEYQLSQKMILCLSKYFRYVVRLNSNFVELYQEMDHIRNYFEIQSARYPDLFTAEVTLREELSEALIPPLIIQNFAENAIKYALNVNRRTTIQLSADYYNGDCREHKMCIRLLDTGDGISQEILEKIELFQITGKPQEGLGVGIQNTIERLKYLYCDRSYVRIWRRTECSGTGVEITLPIHYQGDTE